MKNKSILICKKCKKPKHQGFYEIITCATTKYDSPGTNKASKRKTTNKRPVGKVSRRPSKSIRTDAVRDGRPTKSKSNILRRKKRKNGHRDGKKLGSNKGRAKRN